MTAQKTIGSWSFGISREKLRHTAEIDGQATRLLGEWAKHFAHEPTWVQQKLGLPSVLVRLDMVVRPDGTIGLYEVEERPGGLALTAALSPAFKERLTNAFDRWRRSFGRPIELVVSQERRPGDETITKEELGLKVHCGLPKQSDALYIVRAEPGEGAFHGLQCASISTLLQKGSKSYGVPLGLWKPIPAHSDDLPWSTGFALKPAQSSKMKGMYLCHPDNMPGTIDEVQARAIVRRGRVGYVQPWIDPETHLSLPGYWLVRRIFWAWNPESSSWECLGGLWNARPNVRLHGASDAVFGEIEI